MPLSPHFHKGANPKPRSCKLWRGLAVVFASRKSGSAACDMDAEIKDLHAKIGELTMERDFCLATDIDERA